jgi:hypothetical protein
MWTDLKTLKKIRAGDLFDGRLEKFDVREHTTEHTRCLTDGRNYVWVFITEEGVVSRLITYGWNAPETISNAVEAAFDTSIFSEHEPQYWGFETEDEWFEDAERRRDEKFHLELVKYLQGEPNDIRPEWMPRVQIAKKLVEKDPTLLLPVNKDKFRKEIKSACQSEYQSTMREIEQLSRG